MESGESLAQAPERGKKTWETEQRLQKSVTVEHGIFGYPRNWL